MSFLLFKTRGNSLYPKVKNNSIIVVKPSKAEKIKEGEIVVIKTKRNGYISHLFLGEISQGKNKYIATCPFKAATLDSPAPISSLLGTVKKYYNQTSSQINIKTTIPPFLLLLLKSITTFSYFFCTIIYFSLRFNFKKIKNACSILILELSKWKEIWYNFVIRRI
jgi:hypothetical protein